MKNFFSKIICFLFKFVRDEQECLADVLDKKLDEQNETCAKEFDSNILFTNDSVLGNKPMYSSVLNYSFYVYADGKTESEAIVKGTNLLGIDKREMEINIRQIYDGTYSGRFIPRNLINCNPSRKLRKEMVRHIQDVKYPILDQVTVYATNRKEGKDFKKQMEKELPKFLLSSPVVTYFNNGKFEYKRVLFSLPSGKSKFHIDFENGKCIDEDDVYRFCILGKTRLHDLDGISPLAPIKYEDLIHCIFVLYKRRDYSIDDVYIYIGNELTDIFYDVSILKFIAPGKYVICDNIQKSEVKDQSIYSIYLYNKGLVQLLYRGKCNNYETAILECKKINLYKQNFIVNGMFSIYFYMDYSKKAIALLQYLKSKNCIEKLENVIKDDPTCNYVAKIKLDDKEAFCIIYQCLISNNFVDENEIGGYGVMEHALDYYIKGIENPVYPILSYSVFVTDEEAEENKSRIKELYEVCNEKYSSDSLPKCLKEMPSHSDMFEAISKYIREKWGDEALYLSRDYDNVLTKYYSEALETGNYAIKWKSEFKLYTFVRKKYPDAKYQYKQKWLGLQSIDIYIPSLHIGIEYQGIQHYESVSIFGGETELIKRKKLDEYKREKCKKNGVMLIEWKYDIPISMKNLNEKISECLLKMQNES